MNPAEGDHIVLDLDRMLRHALVGARRAHAFMAIGLADAEKEIAGQLGIKNGLFRVSWLPAETPAETLAEIAEEYRVWLAAGALMELDKHFSTFCDIVWEAIQLVTHGPVVSANRSFAANTNVGAKMEKLRQILGYQTIYDEYFEGYSLARNTLSHNHGIVRDRDCNDRDSGLLVVRYRMPTTVLHGDDEILIDFDSTEKIPVLTKETQVSLRLVEHELRYRVGERIRLGLSSIICLCISYETTAKEIIKALEAFLRAKGIVDAPTSTHGTT